MFKSLSSIIGERRFLAAYAVIVPRFGVGLKASIGLAKRTAPRFLAEVAVSGNKKPLLPFRQKGLVTGAALIR
ncbi:MAG: hypothetical protein ACM3SV_03250 [Betaproteobacteria bacterium]